ncbi:MAG: MarR family transcriptional regulator [Gammaproteobacteria bacterium]|nr:MarR family transcriptional regulator [Gammaproteobacteria bacterium]
MRERFGFALSRLARSWRRHLDARLAPQGISYARWVTLIYLHRAGEGMQQRELADFMGIEAPTLVRTLDQLERLGLIERRPHPQDRRAKTVHLTAAASRDLAAFSEAAASVRGELLAGIDDAELEVCFAVLERVLANARRLDQSGTPT